MMFLFALVRAEEVLIDELARCWRSLPHEHGEHLEVFYDPPTLRVADCPPVIIDPMEGDCVHVKGSASSEDSPGTELNLKLCRQNETFTLLLQDAFHQGITHEGQCNAAEFSRRRQLSLTNIFTDTFSSQTKFSDSFLFGHRLDCRREKCPDRWKDCWPGSATDLLQLQVFVMLTPEFCDHFTSTSACEEYTLGMFRDMNMLYENQMGISLRPAFLMPPKALQQFFPAVLNGNQEDMIARLTTLICNEDQFQAVIGRPRSDFGLFHVLIGEPMKNKQGTNTVGRALVGDVTCTCQAVGWSSYGDGITGTQTWTTMAHEIAHNFNGHHFFKKANVPARSDEDAGMLGYGDGTVDGVVAFNNIHKANLCATVRRLLVQRSNDSGCFHPYFASSEEDARFGPQYEYVLVGLCALLGLILILAVIVVCYFFRNRSLREQLKNVAVVSFDTGHNSKALKEVGKLQHQVSELQSINRGLKRRLNEKLENGGSKANDTPPNELDGDQTDRQNLRLPSTAFPPRSPTNFQEHANLSPSNLSPRATQDPNIPWSPSMKSGELSKSIYVNSAELSPSNASGSPRGTAAGLMSQFLGIGGSVTEPASSRKTGLSKNEPVVHE